MKIKETKASVAKEISKEDILKAKQVVEQFLKEFISSLNKKLNFEILENENNINIEITGEDSGFLIGYRGEVLNSLQVILNNIANKDCNGKIKILLNIGGYREKREKDLQVLATKIAATVVKTGRKITLEPMTAFERKIIHTKLMDNNKVKTYSVGEEPYRKIIVDLNK